MSDKPDLIFVGDLQLSAQDVLAERRRQMTGEGWTPEHDDTHTTGELASAAACYALCRFPWGGIPAMWPWSRDWWKPKDRRRNLVRAAALILAEIERIDRVAAKEGANHHVR